MSKRVTQRDERKNMVVKVMKRLYSSGSAANDISVPLAY